MNNELNKNSALALLAVRLSVGWLMFYAAVKAGRYYGLENWCENLPICRNYKGLHKIWG